MQFPLTPPTPPQTRALSPRLPLGHCTRSYQKWWSNQRVTKSSWLLGILVLSIFPSQSWMSTHRSIIPSPPSFKITGVSPRVSTPVTVWGGQWDSHPFSPVHLPLIRSWEVPATGKFLTVACISASHSKVESWEASRAKAGRAKAGIDIFNHSISPLTLFDASTRLTGGESVAHSVPARRDRYLFSKWPVQWSSLLWPFATSQQGRQPRSSPGLCKLKHREHSLLQQFLPPTLCHSAAVKLTAASAVLSSHLLSDLTPACHAADQRQKAECSQAEQLQNSNKHVTSHLYMLDNFTSVTASFNLSLHTHAHSSPATFITHAHMMSPFPLPFFIIPITFPSLSPLPPKSPCLHNCSHSFLFSLPTLPNMFTALLDGFSSLFLKTLYCFTGVKSFFGVWTQEWCCFFQSHR